MAMVEAFIPVAGGVNLFNFFLFRVEYWTEFLKYLLKNLNIHNPIVNSYQLPDQLLQSFATCRYSPTLQAL